MNTFLKILRSFHSVSFNFIVEGIILVSSGCESEKSEFIDPELTIIFPGQNEWVEGSFDVKVLVSSTVGLTEMELIVNDQLNAVGQVKDTSRITWNTQDLFEENHSPKTVSLFARIRIPDGRNVTTDTVSVTILFPRQLTIHPGRDIQPEWNNEGISIIFKSNREMADSLYRIFTVSPTGDSPELITTERIYHGYPGWSPDGQHIVFNSYDIETEHWWEDMNIFTANISTGETHQITDDTLFDDSGRWSPNGNWISFHSTRSGNKDVWKIPITSNGISQGDPVRLTFGSGNEECARWSPNGEQLAFVSEGDSQLNYNDGFENIGIMNSDGGDLWYVTDDQFQNSYPNWSPDGNYLVYNSKQFGEKDIFVTSLQNGEKYRITMDPGKDDHASWSADGKTIAFASERSGNRDIWTVEIPDILNIE